jgi:hypothetical protein
MTIPQAVKVFCQDGRGRMSPKRLRLLLQQGRVPGYVDPVAGVWIVTEAKVLPKVKQ